MSETQATAPVPLVSINLANHTVSAERPEASVSTIEAGTLIKLSIPDESAPLAYKISIPLDSDESLSSLPSGGAAVIRDLTTPEVADPEATGEESDWPGDIPEDGSPDEEPFEDEVGSDDLESEEGEETPSAARSGWEISNDAVEQLEAPSDETTWRELLSAFDPPSAVDAEGNEISVTLTKRGEGLVLRTAPPDSASFPIEVTLLYGFDPDSHPGRTSRISRSPRALTSRFRS